MEKKKIHYGWYIVIGCLLITCTMVPPIMALSNKFLIQVTEELGLSRSGFTLANTILQGLGIFISPMVSSRLAKGYHLVIVATHQHYRIRTLLRLLLPGSECNSPVYLLCIHWSILVKFCTDPSKYDDHKLVC